MRLIPLIALLVPALATAQVPADTFSLEQISSYPFTEDLVAAPSGSRIAWVLNQGGHRNVWTAEGPGFKPKQLTAYDHDDGMELTSLSVSPDGQWVVYVRGGDHDSNWEGDGVVNPAAATVQPKIEIFAVSTSGGNPRKLAEGDFPVISPKGDRLVFVKGGQIQVMGLADTTSKQLFYARGTNGDATWSPDGSALAFTADRGDHSFIGIYRDEKTPIQWLAPTTSRDFMPRWSPDGKQIAYVRMPGQGGAPRPILVDRPDPWAIWTADVTSGTAKQVWASSNTLRGSYPETDGSANLHWAAGDRIVFLSDQDGWEHLYSVPVSGGKPTLLTPGHFMTEFISISRDGSFLVYSANTGPDQNDDDRRHIFRVSVDRAEPVALTPGDGLEWGPVVTGDGQQVAFIGAGTAQPPVPGVVSAQGGPARSIGAEFVPADFPAAQLVVPTRVTFKSPDGLTIHGQLFRPKNAAGKHPGVVFVHGGPPRQMLLGWHYMGYYSHGYALNQYLANHGYVVLTVNYRLGIGYGHDFHHPAHAGPAGNSEYQDVRAAGMYLGKLAGVDSTRIGIWGGSYGGLLTAHALAHDSKIFRTGVDLHGVHDWPEDMDTWQRGSERKPYETSDFKQAMLVAWQSSPASDLSKWTSPVLLIQGDDDRNVSFHQTVDLARRLAAHHIRYEELVLPDEIHGFLRHASWLQADQATVAWFERELKR
ncbi:MAG: prolyl oligopeptidase family serine peptidase [Gemmatimonadota bacterium]